MRWASCSHPVMGPRRTGLFLARTEPFALKSDLHHRRFEDTVYVSRQTWRRRHAPASHRPARPRTRSLKPTCAGTHPKPRATCSWWPLSASREHADWGTWGAAVPPPESRSIVTTLSMAQRARFITPIVRVAARAPPGWPVAGARVASTRSALLAIASTPIRRLRFVRISRGHSQRRRTLTRCPGQIATQPESVADRGATAYPRRVPSCPRGACHAGVRLHRR